MKENYQNPYEKINNEEVIKNRLYKSIQEMYKHVMFSDGVKWLGYGASVGFKVEGIEWHEPPLQRLLSQLHLKKDATSSTEYVQLIKNSIDALKSFDYTKEVLPSYHQEFIDFKCQETINNVANELEQALKEVEK